MALKSIFLLAFVSVSITAEPLFNSCNREDIKCLSHATEAFLSKTYGGFPSMNIKPIDPMIAPLVEIALNDIDLQFRFKNSSVTGLKSLKINDFKMDLNTKSVLLKMKVDLSLVSNVEVDLTKVHKTFKGEYIASMTVLGTSEYGWDLKNVSGEQYFVVGPEKNTCEILGDPIVTLGADLQNTIDTDTDAIAMKPIWEPRKMATRKKVLCTIVNQGFEAIIHNLRMAANAFPKGAFFKDI